MHVLAEVIAVVSDEVQTADPSPVIMLLDHRFPPCSPTNYDRPMMQGLQSEMSELDFSYSYSTHALERLNPGV